MRRALFVVLLAGALVVLVAGPALATVCVNANKPAGAGNIGDVLIDPISGDPIIFPTNPGGQLAGGFVDIYVDFDMEGDIDPGELVLADTFILNVGSFNFSNLGLGFPPELPEGAHAAAGCDQGVDHAGSISPEPRAATGSERWDAHNN